MKKIYPDYYKDFHCIKGECKHNCCIGWEIDIDDDTNVYYNSVKGEMGKRLRDNISKDGAPHFILSENERCPFLNSDNLCDIIIELGKEHICNICTEHPRFRNDLPDRVEFGLGLCCEAAGRLILGRKEPVELIDKCESDDQIIALRDRVITILQNRERSINERIYDMLNACSAFLPERSLEEWIDILLGLERLDDKWTKKLENIKLKYSPSCLDPFNLHMATRQNEYEQLLVYFIYRHFANAFDLDDAAARACFAVLGYMIIYAAGAVMFTENGSFCFEDQVELARIFSSEIEYSEENLNYLLDEMI